MQPPPRTVPAKLRRLAGRQAGAWGGLIFGVLFAALGSVFMVKMFPWRIDRDVRFSLSQTAVAPGHVTAVTPAHLQINHIPVFRFDFEFTRLPGETVRGSCFATGHRYNVSQPVLIEYIPDDPARCRIQGTRFTKGGGGTLMIAIFPAVGLGLVALTLVNRQRADRLLRDGELTEATVISFTPTNTRVNNRQVFRIELQLEGLGEKVTVRRYAPAIIALLEKRGVGGVVSVLFDPRRPKRLMLVEALES